MKGPGGPRFRRCRSAPSSRRATTSHPEHGSRRQERALGFIGFGVQGFWELSRGCTNFTGFRSSGPLTLNPKP